MRKNIKQKMDEYLSELQEAQKRYEKILAEYNEQEEKARNKRFAERGKAVEKALPELAALTKKQFETYLEKVMLSDDSRLILMELAAEDKTPAAPMGGDTSVQNGGTTAPKPAQAPTQSNAAPTQKPAQTAHNGNSGGNHSGGNNTGQQA
jgi:hypothetical protein